MILSQLTQLTQLLGGGQKSGAVFQLRNPLYSQEQAVLHAILQEKLKQALNNLRLAEEMFTDPFASPAQKRMWLRRLKRAQRRYSRLKHRLYGTPVR